jgi:hypothetical protein
MLKKRQAKDIRMSWRHSIWHILSFGGAGVKGRYFGKAEKRGIYNSSH